MVGGGLGNGQGGGDPQLGDDAVGRYYVMQYYVLYIHTWRHFILRVGIFRWDNHCHIVRLPDRLAPSSTLNILIGRQGSYERARSLNVRMMGRATLATLYPAMYFDILNFQYGLM